MSELGGETRDLLRLAKRTTAVDPEAVARVRSVMIARMTGTAAVGAGTKAATLASWKMSIVALFSALATATTLTASSIGPAPLVMQPSTRSSSPVVVASPSAAISIPIPIPIAPEPAASEAPAPPAARKKPVVRTSWAEDLERLRAAQGSLAAGDPATARRIGETMSRESPFEDERGALVAIAACRASSADADRLARTFVEKRPGTALALRVADACARR